MILTLIIVVDYWLLWFARKHLTTPWNLEIHLLVTLLVLLMNLMFLCSHSPLFGTIEKRLSGFLSRPLGFLAKWVDRNAALILVAVLAYGTVIRFNIIFSYPIDRSFADMLPLIQKAIASTLSGENPYRFYQMPWPLPLVYFPMLWISYIPSYLLRMDIRFTGIVICVVIFFIFWFESRRIDSADRRGPVRRLLVFALGISFFLSDYVIFFTASGHSFPYWLFLTLYLDCLYNDRMGWAAIFLGFSVAARQPAVFLVPFFLIYAWKNAPPKKFVFWATLLIFTGILLILPFFLANPKAFISDALGNVGGELSYGWRPAILGSIGFTNIFYLLKLTGFLKYIQLGILTILFALGLIKVRKKSSLYVFSGITILFYNMFLFHIPVHYFYIPVFLILSFAVLEQLKVQTEVSPSVSFSWGKFLRPLAAALTPVVLLFLLFSDIRKPLGSDRINLHKGFEQKEQNEHGVPFNWAIGGRAVASIAISWIDIVSGKDKLFVFDAFPFAYSGSPPQTMKILFNDLPLSNLRMKQGWNRYRLTLPARFLIIGSNKFVFEFAYATAPRDVRSGGDRRRLSAAFRFYR